jgi:hypothetical protein
LVPPISTVEEVHEGKWLLDAMLAVPVPVGACNSSLVAECLMHTFVSAPSEARVDTPVSPAGNPTQVI